MNKNQNKETTKIEVIIAIGLFIFSVCFGVYNSINYEENMIAQSSHTTIDNGVKRYIKEGTLDITKGCIRYIEVGSDVERIDCNSSVKRINR